MGLLSNTASSLSRSKSRSKSDASQHTVDSVATNDESANDTSTLDKEEGNILMSLISQLRPGMDLTKIALPTFVLEPRSLLERITDFFSHPELIFGAGEEEDPQERFMMVMTFYLSGWHIKPKGVKKPYNPVLGEFFRCAYYYPDGSQGFYVAEQVSHHPPVSAFFYISPKNGLVVSGELKPKSRFLGNSAATIMEGEDRIRLLNRPEDGEYVITMPNTYARGILFGKMTLELCDPSTIACPNTGYHCDVDFKAKGWISGGYNVISGHVKGPNRTEVGEISGHWSSKMEFVEKRSGTRDILFDPARASVVPKSVLPESEQEENESRRLWTKLTDAIKSADMHGATAAKSAVEDRQRELAKKREVTGDVPETRFFKHVAGDRWNAKLDIDSLPKDPVEMEDAVKKWIFGDNVPQPGGSSQRASISTPAPPASAKSTTTEDSASSVISATTGATAPPPAAPTAPGPPAPGPKLTHPI